MLPLAVLGFSASFCFSRQTPSMHSKSPQQGQGSPALQQTDTHLPDLSTSPGLHLGGTSSHLPFLYISPGLHGGRQAPFWNFDPGGHSKEIATLHLPARSWAASRAFTVASSLAPYVACASSTKPRAGATMSSALPRMFEATP